MHVIDEAIRQMPKSLYDHKAIEAYSYRAKRYIFDDDTAALMGHFIAEYPDLMFMNIPFALPPFEYTYVELPIQILYKAGGMRVAPNPLIEPDERVGYIFAKNRLFITCITKSEAAGFGPFFFEKSQRPSMKTCFPGEDEFARLAVMLGSSFDHLEKQPDEIYQFLTTQWGMHKALKTDMFYGASTYQSAAGDWRVAITALIFLNLKKHIIVKPSARKTSIIKGKRVVEKASDKITINILKPKIKSVFNSMRLGPRQSPGQHEVEEHWVRYHLEKNPTCAHNWELFPDDKGHWKCRNTGCTAFKVRRKAHERGDPNKPAKQKEHLVKL